MRCNRIIYTKRVCKIEKENKCVWVRRACLCACVCDGKKGKDYLITRSIRALQIHVHRVIIIAHCYNAAQFNLISMRFNLVPVSFDLRATSLLLLLLLTLPLLWRLLLLLSSYFFYTNIYIYFFSFDVLRYSLRIVPFYSNPYTK